MTRARLYEIKVLFWSITLLVGLLWIAYEATRPLSKFEAQLQCLHEWVENEKEHGPPFRMSDCLTFYGGRP